MHLMINSNVHAIFLYDMLSRIWLISEMLYICLDVSLTKKGAIKFLRILVKGLLIFFLIQLIDYIFGLASKHSVTLIGNPSIYLSIGLFLLITWDEIADNQKKIYGGILQGALPIIFLFISLQTAFYFALFSRFNISVNPWIYIYAGCFLWVAGILIRLWSVVTLGKFFRLNIIINKNHKVIEKGPYRYVRHPAYFGALLIFLGIGLMMGNLLSLASLIVINTIAIWERIVFEEDSLKMHLGNEYLNYMKRTKKRLIPFIF